MPARQQLAKYLRTAVCGAAVAAVTLTPAAAETRPATPAPTVSVVAVAAMPQYLGKAMIKSARWRYTSQGWTLEVTPTKWSRAWAGHWEAGVAGWNELYNKYKNRGLNTNLGGMRDQYICHQHIVAVRAPRKPTWNLDEWRPNVSYAATVRASCNPNGRD